MIAETGTSGGGIIALSLSPGVSMLRLLTVRSSSTSSSTSIIPPVSPSSIIACLALLRSSADGVGFPRARGFNGDECSIPE